MGLTYLCLVIWNPSKIAVIKQILTVLEIIIFNLINFQKLGGSTSQNRISYESYYLNQAFL